MLQRPFPTHMQNLPEGHRGSAVPKAVPQPRHLLQMWPAQSVFSVTGGTLGMKGTRVSILCSEWVVSSVHGTHLVTVRDETRHPL